MTTTDNSSILEKVRKLLAMANDERGNENERENALRMAHGLLTKHGLDLQDVNEHEREKMDPRVRVKQEGWSMAWAKYIYRDVGNLFMCQYFYGKRFSATGCEHNYVGRESNVMTAMYMSAYVINNILKEARRLYQRNTGEEARSFATGAMHRLSERIAQLIKDKQTETQQEYGLALIDLAKSELQANKEYLDAEGMRMKRSNAKAVASNGAAWEHGRAHGDTINLNVQMAGGQQRALEHK